MGVHQGGGIDIEQCRVAAELLDLTTGRGGPGLRSRRLTGSVAGTDQPHGRPPVRGNCPGDPPADVAGSDLVAESQRVGEVLLGEVLIGAVAPGVPEDVAEERVHTGERDADGVMDVRAQVVADGARADQRSPRQGREFPPLPQHVCQQPSRLARFTRHAVERPLHSGVDGERPAQVYATATLFAVLVGHDPDDQLGDVHNFAVTVRFPTVPNRFILITVVPATRVEVEVLGLQHEHGSFRAVRQLRARGRLRLVLEVQPDRCGELPLHPRSSGPQARRSAIRDRLCDQVAALTGVQPGPGVPDDPPGPRLGLRQQRLRQHVTGPVQLVQASDHVVEQAHVRPGACGRRLRRGRGRGLRRGRGRGLRRLRTPARPGLQFLEEFLIGQRRPVGRLPTPRLHLQQRAQLRVFERRSQQGDVRG